MIIGSKKLGDFLGRVHLVICLKFWDLDREKGKIRGWKRLRKFKGILGIGIGCSEKQSTRTAKSTAEFWRF